MRIPIVLIFLVLQTRVINIAAEDNFQPDDSYQREGLLPVPHSDDKSIQTDNINIDEINAEDAKAEEEKNSKELKPSNDKSPDRYDNREFYHEDVQTRDDEPEDEATGPKSDGAKDGNGGAGIGSPSEGGGLQGSRSESVMHQTAESAGDAGQVNSHGTGSKNPAAAAPANNPPSLLDASRDAVVSHQEPQSQASSPQSANAGMAEAASSTGNAVPRLPNISSLISAKEIPAQLNPSTDIIASHPENKIQPQASESQIQNTGAGVKNSAVSSVDNVVPPLPDISSLISSNNKLLPHNPSMGSANSHPESQPGVSNSQTSSMGNGVPQLPDISSLISSNQHPPSLLNSGTNLVASHPGSQPQASHPSTSSTGNALPQLPDISSLLYPNQKPLPLNPANSHPENQPEVSNSQNSVDNVMPQLPDISSLISPNKKPLPLSPSMGSANSHPESQPGASNPQISSMGNGVPQLPDISSLISSNERQVPLGSNANSVTSETQPQDSKSQRVAVEMKNSSAATASGAINQISVLKPDGVSASRLNSGAPASGVDLTSLLAPGPVILPLAVATTQGSVGGQFPAGNLLPTALHGSNRQNGFDQERWRNAIFSDRLRAGSTVTSVLPSTATPVVSTQNYDSFFDEYDSQNHGSLENDQHDSPDEYAQDDENAAATHDDGDQVHSQHGDTDWYYHGERDKDMSETKADYVASYANSDIGGDAESDSDDDNYNENYYSKGEDPSHNEGKDVNGETKDNSFQSHVGDPGHDVLEEPNLQTQPKASDEREGDAVLPTMKVKAPNKPTNMVLFYTWLILIVLIAVVTISTCKSRMMGLFSSAVKGTGYQRTEEGKVLLEHEYV